MKARVRAGALDRKLSQGPSKRCGPRAKRGAGVELMYFIYLFLRLHLHHMEVPRLGVELELQLQA